MMNRRSALLVGGSASLAAALSRCSEASTMQALDFERARIFWTTKAGIDGSWRVIAAACRKGADGIYLAPAVMAGEIFGTGRLPRDPPYSYQLVATQKRHAIIRRGGASELEDSEADNDTAFSLFDIFAPQRESSLIDPEAIDQAKIERRWPLSARLTVKGSELWILEFPVSHISSRGGAFQIESGPALIPRDLVNIPETSTFCGCYLAYVFLNKPNQVDVLAFGRNGNFHRQFAKFARIEGIQIEILSRQSA
ncbi:hypothetical protein WHZ78_23575 [Bradyrhizobium symbiodeficiens]|uniref:hypothetical protein n=1 Tax=Bradyrhizobium symbiodeficiens TaxID=1404367 RepID=UPI0030D1712C